MSPPQAERDSTRQLRELVRYYAAREYTVNRLSVLLGRKPATIKAYARKERVAFLDYTPRSLKN
jgi:hypothetical protein